MSKLTSLDLPKSCKPLKQGALDSLCGMYAVINAIRIAAYFDHSPRKNIEPVLSNEAFKYLAKKNRLKNVIRFGMGAKLQRKLLERLLAAYRNQYGGDIEWRAFADSLLVDAGHFVEVELRAGRAVCVRLDGAVSHYTVISGISDKKVELFDSEDRSWLNRTSVSFREEEGEALYNIKPSSVYSVGLPDFWDS